MPLQILDVVAGITLNGSLPIGVPWSLRRGPPIGLLTPQTVLNRKLNRDGQTSLDYHLDLETHDQTVIRGIKRLDIALMGELRLVTRPGSPCKSRPRHPRRIT